MDFAVKQFEIALYTAVIAAAEQAGEPEVARLCRLNRGEDEDMAEWLEAQIAIVIVETVGNVQLGA
jgi:ferritin-like metal-binding protein YciE